MKRLSLFLSPVFCFVVAVASCSKNESEKPPAENQTFLSAKKSSAVVPHVVDPEKKYAQIICGDSTKVGTACNVIGSTCKFYECNATPVTKPLSEKEIVAFARMHADDRVKNGFIERKDAEITIAMMMQGLREHNKRLK